MGKMNFISAALISSNNRRLQTAPGHADFYLLCGFYTALSLVSCCRDRLFSFCSGSSLIGGRLCQSAQRTHPIGLFELDSFFLILKINNLFWNGDFLMHTVIQIYVQLIYLHNPSRVFTQPKPSKKYIFIIHAALYDLILISRLY